MVPAGRAQGPVIGFVCSVPGANPVAGQSMCVGRARQRRRSLESDDRGERRGQPAVWTGGRGPSALAAWASLLHSELMIVDEGLELLTEDEARGLLATGEVGRVGITIGALPAIFPVNYRLIDGSIVFRTAPGSKMSAAAEDAVVAFEVDDYQLADRSGWSVLAVGRAEVIHDLAMSFKVLDARLEPFVDGSRTAIVRIEPTFISGRRIVHDPPPSLT